MTRSVERTRRMRTAFALLLACSTTCVGVEAAAQSWPSRPIRLVAPFTPSGGADVMSRIIAQALSEQLGQQVVVDNRGGAGGRIAMELVAKSPADGYTLILGNVSTFAILPASGIKLPFDPRRDFAAVSLLGISYAVVVVSPQSAIRTVQELIALAKAKPGQLHFGSSGVAAASHLAGELFNAMAGVKIVHVAYKGAPPALTDLTGGRIDVMFASPPSALPLVRSSRLRAIATTGNKRAAYAPELPTVSESGVPGYENTIWQALLAPAATPPALVTRLYEAVAEIAKQPDLRERFAGDGAEPVGSSPRETAAQIAAEIERHTQLVRSIGLKVE